MSMINFILKQRKLQRQHPLMQKVLLMISFAMLSSELYAQRYRSEYDDVTPNYWWSNLIILIALIFYCWIRNSKRLKHVSDTYYSSKKRTYFEMFKCFLLDIKDNPWRTLTAVVVVAVYAFILLSEWFFYALLAMAVLGLVIYVKWSDKIDKFISRRKNK